MASRKDSKGRVLKKGECIRKSDGRYIYTYTDPLGRRKFIYATDIVELRRKEQELMRDQLDGLDMYVRGTATINTTFDRYISTKNNLRDSTMNGYIYTYNHFVRDTFGKKRIAEVRYSDVLHYYLYLLEEEEIAVGTLDSVHCVLHPTFQMAVRDDIIRKNPSDGVIAEITKKTGKHRGIRRALTVQQQKTFMDYVANHPVYNHWWPLFTVLLGTGTRIGECLGLRWEDIDFDNKMLEINHTIAYYPTDGTKSARMRIHLPKTDAGIRTIPILPEVMDALMMAKEEQEEEGIEQPILDGMTGFVFLNRYGDVMNPQSVNNGIKRIIASYNANEELEAARERREPFFLDKFTCHVLRHTFATRLCMACTNVKIIQSIMGHKEVSTTFEIYAEATDDAKKNAFEMLSEEFGSLF